MPIWNPWRGCHKYSEGCKHCYIHKGDYKRGIDTNNVKKTKDFYKPIEKKKNGEYKIKGGQTVYLCFSSDFLISDADEWRKECFTMIKERSDLNFIFLTKRIERFSSIIPDDWEDGYDNVTVGCTVENQKNVDKKLSIFSKLPIKHKIVICQPLIEGVTLKDYLCDTELVIVGGESDYNARPLNYDWVLAIREECIENNVSFEFRQCGTYFIKDNKMYKINTRNLTHQAKKADININK